MKGTKRSLSRSDLDPCRKKNSQVREGKNQIQGMFKSSFACLSLSTLCLESHGHAGDSLDSGAPHLLVAQAKNGRNTERLKKSKCKVSVMA